MPVDTQRRPSRRVQEDGEGSHQREIELKRSRGEISCAECRRLKIKCDKKLPCSSCLRRGCASLCPNGSLATGQGTRFVLAATDHLHRRITKMSERIRQLEDGLAIMQSRVSNEAHPLLRDELLSLKVDKSEDRPLEGEEVQEAVDVIDAFGTLSITDKGTSRFFGAAGGTEILLQNDEDGASSSPYHSSPCTTNVASPESQRDRESRSPNLHPDVIRFSSAFPFTPMGSTREVQEIIESHLPSWERACSLTETYLEQAAWLFRAVSPQQLRDEMLPIIYKRQPPLDASLQYDGPHDLALLFLVFAVGALVDLTQEPYNAEAAHYYNLAKAAITLQSVFDKPELVTIQALHLMSIYNAMSQLDEGDEDGEGATSMEMSWSLIRLCHQLAQTIGLHRDSARWGLHPREVQRRRALFWDLFLADSWQSLATGRPPSITLPYIDCQFPLDDEATLNQEGVEVSSFGSWGFRFACECVSQVAAKTLTAAVPSYSTILDLDATVRDFPIPEFPPDMPIDPTKPSMIMARYVLAHTREVILLCIHRSFFAQAMTDDPVDPLRSPYAQSFLAAYRSSGHILKCIREQFELLPELCSRFWSGWTYAFSAAVVIGSIVTRGPSSTMAPQCLTELDQACELFSRAAVHSKRAAKALIILQKLQSKAHVAYDSYVHDRASGGSSGATPDVLGLLTPTRAVDDEDELAIFGGRTRLMSPRRGGSSTGASPAGMQGVRRTPSNLSLVTPPSQGAISSAASDNGIDPIVVPDPRRQTAPSMGDFGYSETAGANATNGGPSGRTPPPIAVPAHWNDAGELMYQRSQADVYSSYDDGHSQRASGAPVKYEWTPNPDEYQRQQYSDRGAAFRRPSQVSAVPSQEHYYTQQYPHTPLSPEDRQRESAGHMATIPFSVPSSSLQVPNPGPHMGASAPFDNQPYNPSQGGQSINAYQYHNPHMQPTSISVSREHVNIGPSGPIHPNMNGLLGPGSAAPATSLGPGSAGVHGNGAQTTMSYAPPPPRELAEMGLASQSSALNQRWTSFMQDTGLFFNGPNSSM